MKTVGQAIKRRRNALGISQAELAARAEIGEGTNISRIERGEQWPTEDKLMRIAHALDCKASELFAEAEGGGDLAAGAQERQTHYRHDLPAEEALRFALSLTTTIAESHAAMSRALQISFKAVASQLDGSRLLLELRNTKERVKEEPTKNPLLDEILGQLIEQLMQAAGRK